MQFKIPLINYVRAAVPVLKDSQVSFLIEELKKLERTVASQNAALRELEAKVP